MRYHRVLWSLVLCAPLMLPVSAASARTYASPVNLTFALWDVNQQPAMQQIINGFEKQYPNVTVTIQQTPFAGYWNKLATLTAGGVSWDVMWMNGPYFPTYASKGALLDLTPYMKADKVDLSRWPSSLIDLYTWKGHHYALVKDMDTIGLWYNKTLFDRAHVKYPDCSWTWQDYANNAKKLTVKQGGRAAQYGTMIFNTLQQIYGGLFASYGGSVLNAAKTRSVIASPQNIQAASVLQTMLTNGSAMPGLSNATLTENIAFETGKIAMVLDGSWTVLPYTTLMGKGYTAQVTCIPKGPKGRVSVIHGLGMVASARTKHPKEAWEFIKYLAGPQAAAIQAQTGAAIPDLLGSARPWVASHPRLNLPVFLSEIPGSVPYPAALGYGEWYNALQLDFDQMLLGKKSVKDALTLTQQHMNAILSKYYPTP